MIKSIEINRFRALELGGREVLIGKKITAIAGRNSTGKSTLLAMLGNSIELKGFKTINGKSFKTDFSDIIKGSKEHDQSGSNKFKVNFTDTSFQNIIDYRVSRVTWQKNRFRLIPGRKDDQVSTDSKFKMPCIYLGLGRLYPLGEIVDDTDIHTISNNLSEAQIREFIALHQSILGNINQHATIEKYSLKNVGKISAGIQTPSYNYLTNSSGQDNLSQIILALLSFDYLKQQIGADYKGGLLLIDELDATLHPSAQKNILSIFYDYANRLNLQIVFTTHSTTILKEVSVKVAHNHPTDNGNYEIVYFSKANGPLTIFRNPSYDFIENELLLLSRAQLPKHVSVYTEDDEAKWFLESLLREFAASIKIKSLKNGCDSIVHMFNQSPEWCTNGVVILDGDAREEALGKINSRLKSKYLFLPGSIRPEEVIYQFLLDLNSGSQFWHDAFPLGLTKENIIATGPLTSLYKGKDREKYKKWFIDHKEIFDSLNLMEYWLSENAEISSSFKEEFKVCFNRIAHNLLITPFK